MVSKKVLILITRPVWGGAQRYVFDIARYLRSLSWEVCVGFGPDEKPILSEKLKEFDIRTVVFPALGRDLNPLADLRSFFSLWRFMRDEKFDIAHLNSSKAGVLGAIAAKLAGVKRVVFTAHGFAFNERVGWLKKYFYILAETLACLFRDRVITVSEYDRAEALRHGICSPDKIVAIHNGVRPGEAKFLPRDAAREKIFGRAIPRGPVIGCVADFTSNKGLEFFVVAASEIVKRFPAAFFVIIGEGEDREKVQRQIKRLNLDKSFVLPGFIPDAGLYKKAFDIYLCSSVKEGLPYALLYSLEAGIPTVATRVGGIPEIITDRENGLLVPPADPRALAEACVKLIENPELTAKLVLAGQAKIKKAFFLDEMLRKTLEVYEN